MPEKEISKLDILRAAKNLKKSDETYSKGEILEAANNVTSIKLGWYKKQDLIGHTGLVLIFDGVEEYTIDYGTSDRNSIFENSEVIYKREAVDKEGGVHFHKYKTKYKYKSDLCTIKMSDFDSFLDQCLDHRNKKYNFITNNCRNFVFEIAKNLKISVKNYASLINSLTEIKKDDYQTLCQIIPKMRLRNLNSLLLDTFTDLNREVE